MTDKLKHSISRECWLWSIGLSLVLWAALITLLVTCTGGLG